MSKRLDENLGTVDYDGLIVTNEPVADVFTVTIRKEASAKATLKRGTVLALSSGTAGDGKMVALGTTAASNETLTANAILCDDTEIGEAVKGILAFGVMFAILSKGIDLTIGASAGLVACITASLVQPLASWTAATAAGEGRTAQCRTSAPPVNRRSAKPHQ